MKLDKVRAQRWIERTAFSLPGLNEILATANSDILLIGAMVFDFYSDQGWTAPLRRTTGDLDLSIGLVHGESNYETFRTKLLNAKYSQLDKLKPYRFNPPRPIPGALQFIDLLAHPTNSETSDEFARHLIGVGDGFTFSGAAFAARSAFAVSPNVLCPHPVALARLKMASYEADPKRLKDLADVGELAYGLVQSGQHFEMTDWWALHGTERDAKYTKDVLYKLSGESSVEWDMSYANSELLRRGFTEDETASDIALSLFEWSSYLEE